MTVSIDINIHIHHHHDKESPEVKVGGESISDNEQVMPAGEVVTAGDIPEPVVEPEHPPAAATLLKETAFDEHNNLKTDAQVAKTRLYSDPLIEESRKMREETINSVSIVPSEEYTPTYNS